jgi:tetratricopeptide (TPR) repeat protein
VFRGGWEEEAAEKVAGESRYSLSLVDKSLLRRDARGRFDIHAVLRQYAAEKLDEAPGERAEIEHRHAKHYLELAQLAEPELRGDEQGKWLELLEREQDNLRAVLHWAKEHADAEIGLRLGAALWRFWYVRGYYGEGREQLAAMLTIPATISATREPLPAGQPELAESTGRAEDAGEIMRARATVLNGAGVLAFVQGDKAASRALFEESLALSRSLGDRQGTASMLNNLGIMVHQEGDPGAGRVLYEESLTIRRELGDKWGIGASLNNLGLVAQELGEYDEARILHGESMAIRRELGDTLGIAGSLGNLGLVAQDLGEYDEARGLYEESLTLRKELGDKGGMAELFSNLGLVARKQGNYDDARDLYGKGLTLARELGYRSSVALALSNLGLVAQYLGEYDEARTLHKESLALHRDLGERVGVAGSLSYLGAVAAGRASIGLKGSKTGLQEQPGQLERAATLFGAADKVLESVTAVLNDDDRQLYAQNLAIVRSLLSEEVFARAWSEGRAMSMEQAIEFALNVI